MSSTKTGKHPLWGVALPTMVGVLLKQVEKKVDAILMFREHRRILSAASGVQLGGMFLSLNAAQQPEGYVVFFIFFILFGLITFTSQLFEELERECIDEAKAFMGAIEKFAEDYEVDYGVKILK